MGMSDTYHSGKWYVRGSFDVEANVTSVRRAWKSLSVGDLESPLRRLWLVARDFPASGRALELLGGPSGAVIAFSTEAPRLAQDRATWGPATGWVVDALLEEPAVQAWVLTSDEDHVVGVWYRQGTALINTFISGEGFTMRAPLAFMLMERFDDRNIPYTLHDLGGWILE